MGHQSLWWVRDLIWLAAAMLAALLREPPRWLLIPFPFLFNGRHCPAKIKVGEISETTANSGDVLLRDFWLIRERGRCHAKESVICDVSRIRKKGNMGSCQASGGKVIWMLLSHSKVAEGWGDGAVGKVCECKDQRSDPEQTYRWQVGMEPALPFSTGEGRQKIPRFNFLGQLD